MRGLSGGHADPALHGMKTARAALDRLRDPGAAVSSHYVVDEDGTVFRLVPEDRRAWHAGVSHWRGHAALNARSIGIEIVNPGHEWGYRDFPVLQLAAVCDLCLLILARHPIPARNVVGHSDVAPDRKEDPGERFDWRALARMVSDCGRTNAPDLGDDGRGPRRGDAAPGARRAGGDRLSGGAGGRARSGAVHRAAGVSAALAARGGHRPGGRRDAGPPAGGAAAGAKWLTRGGRGGYSAASLDGGVAQR